jgi:SAM-dependent methyltransferase
MNKINYATPNWLAQKINNQALQQKLHLIHGRVVDLGCGTAPYKKDILSVATEYIGVDWQNSHHEQANVDIFADLSCRLPFADCYADTVTAFQVMEHLPEPGFFLSECYRILKPGGNLLITVPFMWHLHEAPHDYFRYTCYGLEYLLKKNRFANIAIAENTGFWQMWVLKFNYNTTRYAKGALKLFWLPIWWWGQVVSPILDNLDPRPEETGSYVVSATK